MRMEYVLSIAALLSENARTSCSIDCRLTVKKQFLLFSYTLKGTLFDLIYAHIFFDSSDACDVVTNAENIKKIAILIIIIAPRSCSLIDSNTVVSQQQSCDYTNDRIPVVIKLVNTNSIFAAHAELLAWMRIDAAAIISVTLQM